MLTATSARSESSPPRSPPRNRRAAFARSGWRAASARTGWRFQLALPSAGFRAVVHPQHHRAAFYRQRRESLAAHSTCTPNVPRSNKRKQQFVVEGRLRRVMGGTRPGGAVTAHSAGCTRWSELITAYSAVEARVVPPGSWYRSAISVSADSAPALCSADGAPRLSGPR